MEIRHFNLHVVPEFIRKYFTRFQYTDLLRTSENVDKPIGFLFLSCADLFFRTTEVTDTEGECNEGILTMSSNNLRRLDVILDVAWEKLNTGHWKDVDIAWRYLYSFTCLLKVLCLFLIKNPDIKSIVKCCDMGILMGAPILDNILSKLANELSSQQSITLDDRCVKQSKKVKLCLERNTDVRLDHSIETKEDILFRDFEKEYFKTATPVLITSALSHWPVFNEHKWSIDYLLEKARFRTVPVEIGSKYTDSTWTQKLLTFEEFVSQFIYKETGESTVGYLAQHNLFDQIPELKEDIMIPQFIEALLGEKFEEKVEINAWFGPQGTVSPLHFDAKHNFLVQVMGEKYVRLYDKKNTEFLYPRDGTMFNNTSQVDVENPVLEEFPLFTKAVHTECLLKPQSMLYIPPGCWHFVRSLSTSFSVSFWWS